MRVSIIFHQNGHDQINNELKIEVCSNMVRETCRHVVQDLHWYSGKHASMTCLHWITRLTKPSSLQGQTTMHSVVLFFFDSTKWPVSNNYLTQDPPP